MPTKETIKRYLWSSGITFLGGFGIVLLANIESVTLDTFKDGTYLSLLLIAGRGGVKAVLEFFVAWYSKTSVKSLG